MRIALGIEYDGAGFFGWQRQLKVATIQQYLERALSHVANETIVTQCAGRTDAGVHATGQVVHFDTSAQRDLRGWIMGANSNLPSGVAVRWAHQVSEDFHARFSATARRYRYIILNQPFRPAILGSGLSHYYHPLNAERMHAAGQCLIGEHDFSAFRAVHCQSNTPNRHVHSLQVRRLENYIIVDIKANAFLHHMVRNITGSLIDVGMGKQPVEWVFQLLAGKDRTKAAATAKAGGLYLIEVDYPAKFALPAHSVGPLFLPAQLD